MTDLPRNPKVLVVDDDPRLRDLLRRYLGENDFSVTVADGGQSMNRIWMRERFDALILDLMMPGNWRSSETCARRSRSYLSLTTSP